MRHKTRNERPVKARWETYGFCSYMVITYADGKSECVDYTTTELEAVAKGITDAEERAIQAKDFWKYYRHPIPETKPLKYTWDQPQWRLIAAYWEYRPGNVAKEQQ